MNARVEFGQDQQPVLKIKIANRPMAYFFLKRLITAQENQPKSWHGY